MLWESRTLHQELLGKEKHGSTQIHIAWNKNWGGEGAPEPPLLAEELLAANGLWGKQSQFLSLFVCFFKGLALGRPTILQWIAPHPCL